MSLTYLDDAVGALFKADPFHGAMLLEVTLIDVDSDSPDEAIKKKADAIPTAATDGYSRIWLNKKFMTPLSIPAKAAVIAHEIQHIARFHLGSRSERCARAAVSSRLSKKEAHMLFNMACDYIINNSLGAMGYPIEKVMPGVKFEDMLAALRTGENDGAKGCMYDPTMKDASEEQVFDIMLSAYLKNPNASANQPTIITTISNAAGGSDMSEDENKNSMAQDNMTPDQVEQKVQSSLLAAATNAQSRGKLPGYVEHIVEQINKPSNPWRSILRQFVSAFDRDDFSYRRVSRRSAGAAFLRPAMFSEKVGEIAVIVDESGSVSDDMLQQGLSELVDIAKNVRPTGITVVMCDTRVTSVKRFKPGQSINIKTGGRGGTDMSPAFSYIKDNVKRPACIICFTDGEIPEVSKPEAIAPVLWAVCNPHANSSVKSWFKPSFGRVITVTLEN